MMRWYVVQVYAGYEKHVQADLLKRIEEEGLQNVFGEILIPEARLRQLFESANAKEQQLFPGYLLIQMEMVPPAKKLISSSSRVLRFLGGMDPVPLTQKEIGHILSQMKGEVALVSPEKETFVMGSEIEITEGPFAGFVGIVDKVNMDDEKLTAMVSIFGRMTPVELSFYQVKQ